MNEQAGEFELAQKGIQTDEISLETLPQEQIDKIMKAFRSGRDVADNYYKSKIEPKLIKRLDAYRATPESYKRKFPKLAELNNWVSRDIKTTVDWMMPSLMEVFTGSDSPVDIVGVNVEDDIPAAKIQQLITYFVTRKNNFFSFFYNFARDGMILNFGVSKVYWRRVEEAVPMEVLATPEVLQDMAQRVAAGKMEILKVEPVSPQGDITHVVFNDIRAKINIPVLENMSPAELRFTPEARDLHDAKFVAHRKIVTGDYLRRKEREGVYQNVSEALSAGQSAAVHSAFEYKYNTELQGAMGRLSDGDDASKEIALYEAYLKVDYNDDGIYEDVILHVVGDTPLKIQPNDMQIPPFFIFSPEYNPHTIFSEDSLTDTLEQLQDLKTALIRQVIINVAKNNMPQQLVGEEMVDMDALQSGDEFVPVRGDPRMAVISIPPVDISGAAMDLVNYAQTEIESQSGSTRYNQGLDSSSLNRTATGITAVLGMADKKIKLIARTLAETAWIPMVKYLILLCQRYMDDEQVVRLTNENVAVRREELSIDYDLIVNVGQGAGTKEAQIQYLMILMQQLYPKLEQIGIVNEISWYNITKELLENMGIRSTMKFMLDPASPEFQQQKMAVMQQQQALQQQAQQYQQALLQLKAADIQTKIAPNINVRGEFEKLPPEVQAQYLQSVGMSISPQRVAMNGVLNNIMKEGGKQANESAGVGPRREGANGRQGQTGGGNPGIIRP